MSTNATKHNFILEIDGTRFELSYKGFSGGRKTVESLDFESLQARTKEAVMNADFDELHTFFALMGPTNAVKVISVVCPDEFCGLWYSTACKHRSLYGVCSFRRVLSELSGSSATLNHDMSDYVIQLRQLCDRANDQHEITTVDAAKSVARDGISITLKQHSNNATIYLVNDVEISLCPRISTATEEELLEVVISIRRAITDLEDIHPLIDRYGSVFCLRVMLVLCEDATYRYFEFIADQMIEARLQLFPRKILKSYGFNKPADGSIGDFCNHILSILEEKAIESVDRLIAGNDDIIMCSSDRWDLYDRDGENLNRISIDFRKIICETLRIEVCNFLRDERRNGTGYRQLYRHYNHLRHTSAAIIQYGAESILDVNVSDALSIKEYLLQHYQQKSKKSRYPLDSVQECFGVLKRFYFWALAYYGMEEVTTNPFANVLFTNARNLSEPVPPAEREDLRCIRDQAEELPECIALAYDLMLLTLARAFDVFHLRISDFDFAANTVTIWTSKRGILMRRQIPDALADRIQRYIASTAQLRDMIAEDYLLLYTPPGRRKNSMMPPKLITPEIFARYINKPLKTSGYAGTVTSRSIRAEGGRTEQNNGASLMDLAIQLGNTPAVADKHYTTAVTRSQLLEKAKLLHSHYEVIFRDVVSQNCADLQDDACFQVFWGHCDAKICIQQNICEDCPLAFKKEG